MLYKDNKRKNCEDQNKNYDYDCFVLFYLKRNT